MRHPFALLSAVALAGVALVGCGDTEPEAKPAGGDGSGGGALEIEAHDIEFDADSYDVAAGTVDMTYVNEGAIPHTLVIEGVDGFKLEVDASGDEDAGTVELEPGTYTLFCDVAGHRDAGMEATLTVG